MKILHTVEYYSPSVGGAQEVVRQVSEHLVKRGHDVTVATTVIPGRRPDINGVGIEEFSVSGNAVRGIRGESDRYQAFLKHGDFDVVMNYAAQQWATDLAMDVAEDIPYAKVMAPCGFSGLHWPAYAGYFSALPGVLRRYDGIIFHSNSYRDVDFVQKNGITGYRVIPNGASEQEFDMARGGFREKYGIPEGEPMLLTVGSHTGIKGHRLAIQAFLRAKTGKATLVIIGNALERGGCHGDCRRRAVLAGISSLGRKKVLLLDPPRDEVVAAFFAADLFVFGSNVECSPLVLFEAMASGTPFITVACGNAEEIVEWGHGGTIVPTIRNPDGSVYATEKDMAEAIERMIMDEATRKMLGDSGRRTWQERFSWDLISGEYERYYKSLLKSL